MVRKHARSSTALLALLGVVAMASPASAATWVSFSAVLSQVRSGPLIRAIINPARADVEIKFRDLSEWHAFYPRTEQPELERLLHARHIRVLFVPRHQVLRAKPAVVHHRLRYIAAAVLLACVLGGGVGYLLWRRRSKEPATASDGSG